MAKKHRRPLKFYYRDELIPGKKNVGYVRSCKYAWDLCTGLYQSCSSSTGLGWDGCSKRQQYWVSNQKPYRKNLPCKRWSNDTMWLSLPTTITFRTVEPHRCPNGSYNYTQEVDTYTPIKGVLNSSSFTEEPELPTLPDVSSLHIEAIEHFSSVCTPLDINIAVNIAELGDTLALVKNAGKALLNLRNFYSKVKKYFRDWKTFVNYLMKGQSSNTLGFLKEKDLTLEASNLYLAWSFAIAPLISDIKKFQDTLAKVDEHVDWIIKNSKIPVPVRFTKDATEFGPSVQSVTYPPLSNTSHVVGTGKFITFYEARYVAYATATFDASNFTRDELISKLRKKAFGFLDPGVFLWELTPFSFVIDWFVNASSIIKRFTSLPPLPVKLTNVGYWIKVTQVDTRTVYMFLDNNYTPRELIKQIASVTTIDYFERRTELPLNYSGIDFSVPGIKQALLGLALGRQLLS